jgi:hypothetical protein
VAGSLDGAAGAWVVAGPLDGAGAAARDGADVLAVAVSVTVWVKLHPPALRTAIAMAMPAMILYNVTPLLVIIHVRLPTWCVSLVYRAGGCREYSLDRDHLVRNSRVDLGDPDVDWRAYLSRSAVNRTHH